MANDLSPHAQKLWSSRFVDRLQAENKMLKLVNHSCESELAQGGNIVQRMKIGSVTTGTYTDGSDMTVTDVVSTGDTLTLDTQRYFLIHLEKTELAKSKDAAKLVQEYADQGIYQLGNLVELNILSTMATEVNASNIMGTAGAPIVLTKDNIEDYMMDMGLLLDEDNVPQGDRIYVVDPATSVLLKKAQILSGTPMADEIKKSGKIGMFNGCDVVQNNNITTVTGFRNIFHYHQKLFFDIAVRISPDTIEMFQLPLRFGKSIKGLVLWGSNSFDPTAGVMLKKAA